MFYILICNYAINLGVHPYMISSSKFVATISNNPNVIFASGEEPIPGCLLSAIAITCEYVYFFINSIRYAVTLVRSCSYLSYIFFNPYTVA